MKDQTTIKYHKSNNEYNDQRGARSIKHQLRRLGYGDQEIDYFYENHYLPSAGKKKPKQKSKR